MSAIIEVVSAAGKRAMYHHKCYTPTKGDLIFGALRLRDSTQCHVCKESIPAGEQTQAEAPQLTQLTLL